MTTDEETKANIIRSSQNWMLTSNTQTTQTAMRIRVTLEDVTILGYCNGLTIAMSLSMLIPVIMNSDVPARNNPIVASALSKINFRFSDREYKPTMPSVMEIGCAIKPTLRSVDARPQSNRLDGERRDGVFHTPYSTNAFPVIATQASAKFTTQLAMMMTC